MRNVFGKIGEEFMGYLTNPLEMMHRKAGIWVKPLWEIFQNDAGYGRKLYDPHPETSAAMLWAVLESAKHLMEAQIPEGQIEGLGDLVRGDGDAAVNAAHAFGPLGGVTFSKGAPGGPAVGELYSAKEEYQYRLDAALPDIRKQILRGDTQGAVERMTELGVSSGLQRWYIKTTLNPATRLSGRALRDFYQYANPDERARMEGYQQQR
jgi:hypothetical protein